MGRCLILRVDVEQVRAKLLAGVNFEQGHAELMAVLDGIAAGKGTTTLLRSRGWDDDQDISIVFSIGAAPIKVGLVESLNRPNGNLTGVSIFSRSQGAKTRGIASRASPGRQHNCIAWKCC